MIMNVFWKNYNRWVNHKPFFWGWLLSTDFSVPNKTEESNERKGFMSDTASVVVLAFTTVVSLIIVSANIFTIYVFWKHCAKLKGHSYLLINLAFADLLVGSIEAIVLATSDIPRKLGKESLIKGTPFEPILRLSQISSFFASIFFLVLISLERAYALIYPLRHRVLSMKSYHWSVIVV